MSQTTQDSPGKICCPSWKDTYTGNCCFELQQKIIKMLASLVIWMGCALVLATNYHLTNFADNFQHNQCLWRRTSPRMPVMHACVARLPLHSYSCRLQAKWQSGCLRLLKCQVYVPYKVNKYNLHVYCKTLKHCAIETLKKYKPIQKERSNCSISYSVIM